jgi:hypothetical protein
MKKLLTICLIMATMFTVNAQDGKPTKEQTIEFIKSYFKDKTFKVDEYNKNDKTYRSSEYMNFNVDFNYNTSQMIINFKYQGVFKAVSEPSLDNETISSNKYIFNINEIESIQTLFYGNGPFEAALKFIVGPNKIIETYKDEKDQKQIKKQEKEVEIVVEKSYGTDLSIEAAKLMKAFNHLRKLCGAPDPISFD